MMSLRNTLIATLVPVVLVFGGCATILNDKTQKVNVVASNGAHITASADGKSFEVPSIVDFTRAKADKIITTDDASCNKQTLATKKVDNMFFINVLSGGAFGSTTDYSTDKMWKYDDTITISCK